MKKIIRQIETFDGILPQKGVWYSYYDELFVSVVPDNYRRAYIRRKARLTENKADNKMCKWHFEWQYKKIESQYGIPISGKKTFEISVNFDGERHIVDSVVNNIALEFQHSLNVTIEEMDKRYYAHIGNGLVPYLLLDFTHYNFQSSFNEAANYTFDLYYVCKMHPNKIASGYAPGPSSIYRKLKKWANCKYFENNRLFIEFADIIIRPLNRKIRKDQVYNYDRYLSYACGQFNKEIFNLESELNVKTKPYDHFSNLRKQ
jgi:hypothetical protein